MLQVGDQAPGFTGRSGDGEELQLSNFSGHRVALYFYPKDDTPGCTMEACSIRDHWEAIQEAGIVVIGVSGDSVKSHQKFAALYNLPFPLVADTEKEIMTTYGVWGEKKMYGKTFLGVKRTTFLIDESGKIVKIFKRPKNRIHGKEILDGFAQLQSPGTHQ